LIVRGAPGGAPDNAVELRTKKGPRALADLMAAAAHPLEQFPTRLGITLGVRLHAEQTQAQGKGHHRCFVHQANTHAKTAAI
jgi:hypothetical protein